MEKENKSEHGRSAGGCSYMTKLVVSFHSSLACLTCPVNEQSTSEKLEQETMQEPESGALCYNRGEAVEDGVL